MCVISCSFPSMCALRPGYDWETKGEGTERGKTGAWVGGVYEYQICIGQVSSSSLCPWPPFPSAAMYVASHPYPSTSVHTLWSTYALLFSMRCLAATVLLSYLFHQLQHTTIFFLTLIRVNGLILCFNFYRRHAQRFSLVSVVLVTRSNNRELLLY